MTKALTYESGSGWVYTNKDVAAIVKLSDSIGELFSWEDTKEGSDYWEAVSENLMRISGNIKNKLGTTGEKL